jgi:GTPase
LATIKAQAVFYQVNMATIKIPQSTAQIKVGGAAPTGSLALPVVQLSQVVGSGYKALGKVVEDIHKEQVTAENNAQFQEIVKKN